MPYRRAYITQAQNIKHLSLQPGVSEISKTHREFAANDGDAHQHTGLWLAMSILIKMLIKIARLFTHSQKAGRRDSSALRGRLQFLRPCCAQFVDRAEHTCGTEAQQSVDSSRILTKDLQHLRASGRGSNQLSYLLLLSTSYQGLEKASKQSSTHGFQLQSGISTHLAGRKERETRQH